MAQYDFETFKACNKKNNSYDRMNLRIEHVNNKTGICTIAYNVYGFIKREDIAIETLVKRYISSTSQLPYITNPSAIRTWKGFQTFRLDNSIRQEVDYMLLGIREQYTDIVQGIGAARNGLIFELKLNDKFIEFSGMMSNEIPFKKKLFQIEGKSMESLKNEIKAYLFDTIGGIVNLC